ncbi:hypothetical protein P5G51_018635 [Virgibacillus sp. 179-BFC.A HS]|uniref:DNA-binding protein n=1 Tax=Tigheibacillus jepli TaxID=3035914 RepID=A0ABU5CL77_9BACI|nr:hypothetical protein [Virgibacillus sp. 179-BFC.A HS]MDY0407079.1 hypothetical protein [Virgibacillus sp. 179-BFC.A HS]
MLDNSNYTKFMFEKPEMKKHIDNMYDLVSNYAKKNNIHLATNDIAETFVEAIATYISDSENQTKTSEKYFHLYADLRENGLGLGSISHEEAVATLKSKGLTLSHEILLP